jgi:hypothetical protein
MLEARGRIHEALADSGTRAAIALVLQRPSTEGSGAVGHAPVRGARTRAYPARQCH